MAQDVTVSYIAMDVERLRRSMQKITDFLLESMKVQDSTAPKQATLEI